MSENKKNVVIGLTKGYDFEILQPFVGTLRKTGYSGDIVFFYSDTDQATLDKLKKFGVILIPFDLKFPYSSILESNKWQNEKRMKELGIYCLRYLLAYQYLKDNSDKYRHVMLSDTRDVIFQKDPFDFQVADVNYFLEREGVSIAESPFNAEWIEKGFGAGVLAGLGHNPIICSGVTIGSIQGILSYLEAFLDIIVKKDVPAHMRGMDQGIHNYLIHENIVPGKLHKNSEGPVLTLGLEDRIVFKGGYVYNAVGKIPNIVHQYDRHWRIARHYWSLRLMARDYYSLWKARFRRMFRIAK